MGVQILVYDDSDVIRESLRTLLFEEPGFDVIAMLANAETVETDIGQLKPDVVLMDIDMPEVNGVEAVKRIRKLDPQLPIIMLTVFDDNENIFKAIYAGASGYILKIHLNTRLIDAVRELQYGGSPMSPAIARKVMNKLQQIPHHIKPEQVPDYNLTPREKEVLSCIVEGLSHKMIADKLLISYETVRSHIKKIYEKLHVASLTEVVSKAMRERIV